MQCGNITKPSQITCSDKTFFSSELPPVAVFFLLKSEMPAFNFTHHDYLSMGLNFIKLPGNEKHKNYCSTLNDDQTCTVHA
jgi:hypothetical protein